MFSYAPGVYNPPNGFYSQIDINLTKNEMFQIIGNKGCNFKYLTQKFNLQYIWWNKYTNVIELWGKNYNLMIAKEGIENYINNFQFRNDSKYSDDFGGFIFSDTLIDDIFEFPLDLLFDSKTNKG